MSTGLPGRPVPGLRSRRPLSVARLVVSLRSCGCRGASDSFGIRRGHQTHRKRELYAHLNLTPIRAVRTARLSTTWGSEAASAGIGLRIRPTIRRSSRVLLQDVCRGSLERSARSAEPRRWLQRVEIEEAAHERRLLCDIWGPDHPQSGGRSSGMQVPWSQPQKAAQLPSN
jgi:hypothetical protein